MLKADVLALKQSLRASRRNRQFQRQFGQFLNISPPQPVPNFPCTFPHLQYLCQQCPSSLDQSYCSLLQSRQSRPNTTSGTTVSEIQEQQSLVSEQEQKQWKQNYQKMKNLPVLESNEEIGRIVRVLNKLGANRGRKCARTRREFMDHLYLGYVQEGGSRGKEEFVDKLQADVLFLVKKEAAKRNQ